MYRVVGIREHIYAPQSPNAPGFIPRAQRSSQAPRVSIRWRRWYCTVPMRWKIRYGTLSKQCSMDCTTCWKSASFNLRKRKSCKTAWTWPSVALRREIFFWYSQRCPQPSQNWWVYEDPELPLWKLCSWMKRWPQRGEPLKRFQSSPLYRIRSVAGQCPSFMAHPALTVGRWQETVSATDVYCQH